MHSEPSQPRPSGYFDSLAARKYPKILVTIRSIVCYSIPSKGEHRATPERREHIMTRKQMIEAIINDQIKRGIVKAENKQMQINARLKGCGALRPMSLRECKEAYDGYFGE